MEQKMIISVKYVKIGMKVAENVFNNYGAIIISEGNILDKKLIQKLEIFNIERIKIYEEVEENKEITKDKIREEYIKQVESFKDIAKDISCGKSVELQKVDKIVHSVTNLMDENVSIMSVINQVRSADQYTYYHSLNVSLLSMMIGRYLKYDETKVRDLVYAGVLHDVGKSKIDPAILNKPGKLTPEEYEEMKKHVVYSYRALGQLAEVNKDIAMGVLMHHEREDGSGYTLGAKGDQIHPYAKIIAIADVYDSMTSNRVYSDRRSPFEVFHYIQQGTFNQFDANIGIVFINFLAKYYIGDICRLSNDETAEIIHINPSDVSKPLVKIDNTYVDLSKEKNLTIVEML